ncbi:MAG: hypothetical protein JRI56_00300 [Deltaproteobacteria bacterium]|nr:hypothetical protein [Deltaproteobacteria bacterium]
MAILDDLLSQFQQQQEAARLANERRYQEGLAIYDRIIKQYEPGGAFLQGVEAQLQREKARTVAQQTQDLVSSGLFGTSIRAGLGKKFEEEIGTPARLRAQDIAFERLAQAGVGKAGFIERREDVGPDYGLVAQLAAQAASAPRTPTSTIRGTSSAGGRKSYVSTTKPTTGLFAQKKTTTTGTESPWRGAFIRGVSGAYAGRGKELTDAGWTYMGGGDWMWNRPYAPPGYGQPGGPAGPPVSSAGPSYVNAATLALGQGPITQEAAKREASKAADLVKSITAPYWNPYAL